MTKIEDMNESYKAAKAIIDAQMNVDLALKNQFQELCRIKPLVIPGQHDHIGQILDAMKIPYDTCKLHDIANHNLNGQKPVFVNCGSTGKPERNAIMTLRDHVEKGGVMITTDWAVDEVLQHTFPGFIERSGNTNGYNESFPIDHDGPDDERTSWFIEASSYTIRILHEDVSILMESKEFGEKYGCNPALAVGFKFGEGGVFHYVSHLYAQMVELRNAKDAAPASEYATSVGINIGNQYCGVTAGSTKTAYDSMSSVINSTMNWKDMLNKGKKGQTVPPSVQIPARPSEYMKLVADTPIFKRDGSNLESFFEIEDINNSGKLNIGRGSDSDIQMINKNISKKHAALYANDNKVMLTDLKSHNGTYVNNNRINSPTELFYGDILKFGTARVSIQGRE